MYLSKESEELASQYSYITNDIDYQKLKLVPRHGFTNTYDHSIRVALMVSKIADRFNLNKDSAIRAALLHDFCLLNYYEKLEGENYIFLHPKEALKNSEKFHLTDEEKDAIISHMFPLGKMPFHLIGWSITLADKIVAFYEKVYGISYLFYLCKNLKRRILFIK